MTGVIQPEESPPQDSAPPFVCHLKRKLKEAILPEQFIWMFYDNEPPTEEQMQLLKESIEKNELIGCTDASTKDGISTASFKFQNKQGVTVLQGESLIPGKEHIQCSHRGEMGGAAAALTYLQTIVEYKNITKGSFKFGCDSDNVVNVGLRQKSQSRSVADHYDLVRRCHEVRDALHPVLLIPVQVKGHTDNITRKKTTMEKINIECDRRAGERRKEAKRNQSQIQEASQIGYWQLHYKNEPVLMHLTETIRLSVHEYDAFEYWTQKNYNKKSEQGLQCQRTTVSVLTS